MINFGYLYFVCQAILKHPKALKKFPDFGRKMIYLQTIALNT